MRIYFKEDGDTTWTADLWSASREWLLSKILASSILPTRGRRSKTFHRFPVWLRLTYPTSTQPRMHLAKSRRCRLVSFAFYPLSAYLEVFFF
jgi:hypothetical protein